jgi:PfpI family intracellular protease
MDGNKIMMVIAKNGFRDEEFKIPYEIFLKNSFKVDIVSTSQGLCKGKLGMQVNADYSFLDVNLDNYSCVVIVGGPGSKDLVGNLELEDILRTMNDDKKLICAICYAPVILAKTGIIDGVRITVWNEDGNQRSIIEESGSIFVDENVVEHINFITANGPKSANLFAESIIKYLKK